MLASSIPSSLAYGIGRMSVVTSHAFFPHQIRDYGVGLLLLKLKVITIWQQDEGVNTLHFVTLYPDKSKTIDALEEESK